MRILLAICLTAMMGWGVSLRADPPRQGRDGRTQEEPREKRDGGEEESKKYSNQDLKKYDKKPADKDEPGAYSNKDLEKYSRLPQPPGSPPPSAEDEEPVDTGDETGVAGVAPLNADAAEPRDGTAAGSDGETAAADGAFTGGNPVVGPDNMSGDDAALDADEPAGAGAADPWEAIGKPTDSKGRGEEYWRRVMDEARRELAAAQVERDKLQIDISRLQAIVTQWDPGRAGKESFVLQIMEMEPRLEEAEQRYAAAERRIRDLEEEARLTKALPGWFR